jgi:hypothetical protein
MKIFISWSGAKSNAVALALRKWLTDVLQNVKPWVSEADIDAGARWSRAIEKELSETSFGIICITRTNQAAPWIVFESGALAKTLSGTFVCPYLIDLEPAELVAGPLAQFQAKRANKKETWELLCAINRALKSDSLPEESLRRAFDRWWPDLEEVLGKMPTEVVPASDARSLGDKTDEILSTVRRLIREREAEGQPGDASQVGLSNSSLKILSAIVSTQAESLERMADLSKTCTIYVYLGIAEKGSNESFYPIVIRPWETLFGTLTAIWAEMQAFPEAPEAFTYLWDWVLVRRVDQTPLLIAGGVTRNIPSQTVFVEGDEWVVHRLREPILREGGNLLSLFRGQPYVW